MSMVISALFLIAIAILVFDALVSVNTVISTLARVFLHNDGVSRTTAELRQAHLQLSKGLWICTLAVPIAITLLLVIALHQ
jgi:hypothetical protein